MIMLLSKKIVGLHRHSRRVCQCQSFSYVGKSKLGLGNQKEVTIRVGNSSSGSSSSFLPRLCTHGAYHNGADSFLAFWLPEDLDWTHIDVVNHAAVITSLVYHKGEFYSMSYSCKVRAYEIAGSNVKTRLVGEIDEYTFNSRVIEYYLVELSGALLLVSQFVKSTPIHTFEFKVSELDIIKGELKDEMKTLGNSSMFVGCNWASCIDSSKFTGIKPNHIYFADKWFRCSSNFDMGAYNLEDGKNESFYPGPSPTSICPPAWVMPSLIK